MRAISVFSLEAGTSTFGWRACIALRTRVSMSAMGSLVIELLYLTHGFRRSARPASFTKPSAVRRSPLLPARLRHAWNLAVESELAEAQAANSELAQER